MPEVSEPSADEEETVKQRLQEVLGNMSVTELFKLLIDIEAKIHEREKSSGQEVGTPVATRSNA